MAHGFNLGTQVHGTGRVKGWSCSTSALEATVEVVTKYHPEQIPALIAAIQAEMVKAEEKFAICDRDIRVWQDGDYNDSWRS